MSFPGNYFTPADQTIGNERAWGETSESLDNDGSGSTITRIVRTNQPRAEEPETAKEESLEDLIDEGQILVNQVRRGQFRINASSLRDRRWDRKGKRELTEYRVTIPRR
jgi:hypothetical protein